MKYAKPEVVLIASAVNAIQGSMLKTGQPNEIDSRQTVPSAYEADE
jgi:hypothetical protein